jgi:hypothetical protein
LWSESREIYVDESRGMESRPRSELRCYLLRPGSHPIVPQAILRLGCRFPSLASSSYATIAIGIRPTAAPGPGPRPILLRLVRVGSLTQTAGCKKAIAALASPWLRAPRHWSALSTCAWTSPSRRAASCADVQGAVPHGL